MLHGLEVHRRCHLRHYIVPQDLDQRCTSRSNHYTSAGNDAGYREPVLHMVLDGDLVVPQLLLHVIPS